MATREEGIPDGWEGAFAAVRTQEILRFWGLGSLGFRAQEMKVWGLESSGDQGWGLESLGFRGLELRRLRFGA